MPNGTRNSSKRSFLTVVKSIDDYKDIYGTIQFKIISFIFCMMYQLFTNTYLLFLILFEKYGGDPLKRSINNQLVTQLSFAMIIQNVFYNTIYTWPIIFGPVYLFIAAFGIYILETWITWGFLLLTEISVVKALSIIKFSWMLGIDENFMGTFLLILNLGFVIGSLTARY